MCPTISHEITPKKQYSDISAKIIANFCSDFSSETFSNVSSDVNLDMSSDVLSSLPSSEPLRHDRWREWAERISAENRKPTTDLLTDDVDVEAEAFMQALLYKRHPSTPSIRKCPRQFHSEDLTQKAKHAPAAESRITI
jgi:hypothetical protein